MLMGRSQNPNHAQRVRIEVSCSTKLHARQLQELERLGLSDVWNDTYLCRNYVIKGLQRFLFMCFLQGIPLGQGLIDLSVRCTRFDDGTVCRKRAADLWAMLQECEKTDGFFAMESIQQKKTDEPFQVDSRKKINGESKNEREPSHPKGGSDSSEEIDWSGFAGVVGGT